MKTYNLFKINFTFCKIHPLRFTRNYSSIFLGGIKITTFSILKSFESFANLVRRPIYPGKHGYVSHLKIAVTRNIQIELNLQSVKLNEKNKVNLICI